MIAATSTELAEVLAIYCQVLQMMKSLPLGYGMIWSVI